MSMLITRRKNPVSIARWRGSALLVRRCQHTQSKPSSSTSPQNVKVLDESDDIQALEEEYSKLKVNWFPGHMVKATKVIREKLKQVDMVFEVRDARIPFSSANDDLDKIVGPGKARLVVLNKSDLANPALEQRVLQRFRDQGKAAVYACGRTGTNVNKLLAWAKERGARRGEFSTTGTVAMVVGMPNVGKSSLINILRGQATKKQRLGGGLGEDVKKVARVGAMPGVTRQVSAFRIAYNPPLYLVDTPGVMVPRVETAMEGLRLALTRAVPDSSVPLDVLVKFMLRMVRLRRLFGEQRKSSRSRPPGENKYQGTDSGRDVQGKGRKQRQQEQRNRSKAVEAWLSREGMLSDERPPRDQRRQQEQEMDGGHSENAEEAMRGDDARSASSLQRQHQRGNVPGNLMSNSEETYTFFDDAHQYSNYEEEKSDTDDDEVEDLIEAVMRESGAEGKPLGEARRMCCRYLLDAFRDGQFGRITLDSIPRVRQNAPALQTQRTSPDEAGWAHEITSSGDSSQGDHQTAMGDDREQQQRRDGPSANRARRWRADELNENGRQPTVTTERDGDIAAILDRDWSKASAWDKA